LRRGRALSSLRRAILPAGSTPVVNLATWRGTHRHAAAELGVLRRYPVDAAGGLWFTHNGDGVPLPAWLSCRIGSCSDPGALAWR
jgi:hypothetical protein